MLERTTESGPKPFTDRYLASLRPASKRYDVLDPSRKGLMLRVTARGTKTFFFRYQKDGRVDRLMIGHYPATPLRQAYEAHAEFTKRIHRGEDPRAATPDSTAGVAGENGPAGAPPSGPTVGELAAEFVRRYVHRERNGPRKPRRPSSGIS